MKKIFHSCLTVSFLLSTFSLPVSANQIISAPPIYVSVLKLNEEVVQIKQDVLNQERSIRDEELLAKQLTQENSQLISKIQEYRQPGDLLKSIDQMTNLQAALENYSRRLDERNRLMMDHTQEIGALKARVEKLEHLFDEVIRLSKNVEAMKNPTPQQVQEQKDLAAGLEDQKELLNTKNAYLKQKDQELSMYIAQLRETREELEKLKALQTQKSDNSKDSQFVGQVKVGTPIVEDQAAKENAKQHKIILEKFKDQTQRFTDLQASLKDKDDQLKKLEETVLQKDQEIAELKNALAQANQKLAQAQAEIDQVKQQLSQQQDMAAAKDQMTVQQQETIDSLHKEVAVVKSGIETMRANYEHDVAGFDRIHDNIVLLKEKLSNAQARASRLDEQDRELVKLKGDIAVLTYELENAKTDLGDYQSHMKGLNMTIKNLNAKLALKDKDLQAQGNQIVELKSQVKDIGTYKEQIKTLRANIVSLQQQIAALQGEVLALKNVKERAALQAVLISKYRILEDLLEEKSSLLMQLATKNKDRGDYYKEQLKATIVYWQELNEQNAVKLENLAKQMNEQQANVETLQTQLKDSKHTAVELESMLDVYQKKMDDKDTEHKNKLVYIDQLQGELQTAQDSITSREADLQKVREYFFELEKKSTEKTQQLRDKNQQLALLSASLEEQKQQVAVLKDKLKNAPEPVNLEQQKQYIQSLQDKLTSLQNQFKSAVDQRDFQLQTQELVLVKEKLRISLNRMKQMQEQLTVAETKLKSTMNSDEFDQNKMQLKNLQEHLTVAEEKLKSSVDQSQLDQAKQFLKSASDEIAQLKISLKAKDDQIELLKNDHMGDAQFQKQLTQAKQQIAKLMEDSYFKDKQIERLNMQLMTRNQGQKELDKVKKDLADTQKQLGDLKEQLNKAKPAITSKDQKDVDVLRNQLKNAIQETKDAQETAKDKNVQVKALSQEVVSLKKQIQDLKNKIESLHK